MLTFIVRRSRRVNLAARWERLSSAGCIELRHKIESNACFVTLAERTAGFMLTRNRSVEVFRSVLTERWWLMLCGGG